MAGALSIIRKSPVFSACSSAEIAELLLPAVRQFQFKRNTNILPCGGESPGVFLIAEGRVKVYSDTGQKQLIFEILGQGEIFGFEYYISNTPVDVNFLTMEFTRAYLLPGPEFTALLEQNHELLLDVFNHLCRRLAASRKRISETAFLPVRERVIAALIYLCESSLDHRTFLGSRADVSRVAAVRRETASRIIHELERQGLVEVQNGRISILRRQALDQLHEPR
jgi:CRP-like cAMP-binding protein